MKNLLHRQDIVRVIAVCTLACLSARLSAQRSTQAEVVRASKTPVAATELSSSASQLIQPEELARIVQSSKEPKPLILYVGFHVLYLQAHIPRSEYIGPASETDGDQQLRKRIQGLRRTQLIVIYCGCCPWSRCPNVDPAYKTLRDLGFTNVKVLYIADNFGKNWVDKGYPVARGE